ncbi:MAG: 3-deoxy-D-manno-octulosonic acid transferase [Caulobacterales bacterium]|jgi:3-deoxy-D-manno-octulosonic-acid transferase
MALALALYRGLSHALSLAAPAWLAARARAGKEDPQRLGERFGRAAAPRPQGRLVWLHAASVGELGVALGVRSDLAGAAPDLEFLITTGTQTSAAMFARAAHAQTRHQFAPLDTPGAVARFLSHWRPDLGVFIESEIWPNLILAARAQGVRLALLNARMNADSLRRWTGMAVSARRLFSAFDVILPADTATRIGLGALLGRALAPEGNLKLAAPAPGIDAALVAAMRTAIAGRPVWLAASTHAGEDEVALAAHAEVRAAFPNALLIIAPRHPERGAAVAALAHARRRALGDVPGPDDHVYVADTIGEMGAWLSLADPALIAGSLRAELKGHNPIEAARMGVAILSGPHVASFADIYAAFAAEDGLIWTPDAAAIAHAVVQLWRDPARAAALKANAVRAAQAGTGARTAAVAALLRLLERA